MKHYSPRSTIVTKALAAKMPGARRVALPLPPRTYTVEQLATQRGIAHAALMADISRRELLHLVDADVRENHRRTIDMRIAHYEKRIAGLDAAIAAA